MDDHSLACYRLGLRLRQAVLIQEHADRSSGPADGDSARLALGRLMVAFDEWVRLVGGSGRLSRLGAEILDSAAAQLSAVADQRDGILSARSLAGRLRALEGACLEWAGTRPSVLTPYGAWLRLGVEIASVQYVPPARRIVTDEPARPSDTIGPGQPTWRWIDPGAVESILAELNVRREVLFPENVALDSVDAFVGGLPSLSYSPGWTALEVGLGRLPSPPTPDPPTRPCYDRDHLFLTWYEAEGTETYHRPANIRDRWNELYPRDVDKRVTRDVVLKAISRARKERDSAARR